MNAPRYHILVIDDNKTDRRLVERQLREASAFVVDVSEAGNHEEGMERLSSQDIDCVLLDYRLGVECGLETLEALRRRGADHALPKPLDGSQVAKVLRRMISEAATPSTVSWPASALVPPRS